MIKLGGLVNLKPITEAPEDRYVSIGFGKYKEKGKEDDENAPTFEKDGNKFVPISTHKAAAKDADAKKDTPKVNIFDKPKKDKPKKDKSSSSNLDANQIGDEISKSIGIDGGTADVNNNNDIEFSFGENDRETSIFIGKDGDTYKVSIENPYSDDFGKDGDIQKFDNQSDAIQHAKKLAKKYSKELGAKEEPKSDTSKAGTSNYDSEYFADDEKSDSSAYDDYDDYDDYEEDRDGVRKTEERLNKVEKALNDTLKLDDKGFTTARSSGGGMGEYEGPLEIYDKNAIGDDGEPREGAATLSIGSGEQNGNMSIALVDFDGQEIFPESDYAITGDKELSAEESFKLGKALMKMPEMQKFLKGEISKDEFKPIYDKIQAKFSKGTAVESKSMRLTNILKEADVFTATSKETGTTSVFKSKAARDAAIKAGTHEKRKDDKDGAVKEPGKKDTPKVNIFKKDKEEPKKDKSSSSKLDANQIGDEISKSIGIDGTVDVNSNGAIEFAFGENDRETSLFIGKEGGKYNVSVENPYGDEFDGDGTFDNQSDAIKHAKKLAKKYSKELGAKKEPKKDDSDNLSTPNSVEGTGQADPKVNKAVRNAAQKAGISPKKLGKEEYEKKMAQAAYEALTDANFHTEARWLVADLEGKPELREKPDYPSIDDKDYDKKIKVIRDKYASQYSDDVDDDAYELGMKSANEAGWAGATAIEGLVFDLKMNGSHRLANTILKSFKDANASRNESTKLGRLLPESLIKEGTRSQVGIIDRSGKIASAYVHYDGYPSNMKPGLKKHMKNEKDVLNLIKQGGARGIYNDKDIEYFDRKEKPSKGNLKDFRSYVDNVDRKGGAEFVYLYNMKDKKWYFANVYGDKELKKLY